MIDGLNLIIVNVLFQAHDHPLENTSDWGPATLFLNFQAYFNKLIELICFNFSILFTKQRVDQLDSLFSWKVTTNFISEGVQEPLCMSTRYFYLSWPLYAFSNPFNYSLGPYISFHHISIPIIIEKPSKYSKYITIILFYIYID